ncbi:MAG: GIY-YIG nuclease family protein [Oscillospiraceae bacterium]|nr:GIY-YIG nuclease family protein [Oscillospiraceae bacterium]
MPKMDFFPPRPDSHPMIYAYKENNPMYRGMLKIGYTKHDVERRVAQQYPTLRPGGKPYKIVFQESAMYEDGGAFTDHDIHKYLTKRGFERMDGEWFRCTVQDVRAAYLAVKNRTDNEEQRTLDFKMRPEQDDAVTKTIAYFRSTEGEPSSRIPKFLWNAKMRFGKTFAAYELAKKMGFQRVLVLTFKPAVESAWREDLFTHVDFEGWQFVSNKDAHDNSINIDQQYAQADKSRPIVVFGSFQDLLGTNDAGGIKAKNEFIHTDNWDLVIFDEYHFGAWRDRAKKLFDTPDEEADTDFDAEKYQKEEAGNAVDETWLPITTRYYLYLSGTPFRALNSGEFIEEQIYNWTYSDEQRAKENWIGEKNPYRALPRMVLMTYKLPDSIRQIAEGGEFNEFDLNVFFSAKGTGKDAKFVYEDYVQKWLDLIRGAYLETAVDELKLGAQRPPMPYSDTRLLNVLSHTLWFLPNVASCEAMRNLLEKNNFYRDYKVNCCAGPRAGIGLAALAPVQKSMKDPLATKTITLTCGKLTTGVTVKPWSGIFMLRNLKSPETYFQAAFRVQSPWEIDGDIMKKEVYVFDFALDRALKQISDYSCRLNLNMGESPEKKVEEFISFLPVIAYDGSSMRQINAAEILDYAMSGTSATLLARRWESALLVNVDNETLKRLMANQAAMEALMKIEGFRSLNQDIETIINKSEKVKKAKKEKGENLTDKEKKELTQEEKEYKSMRKQIQEKLIKFATRVPIFMYLTDYREQTLVDVITQLEPGLFKKVTGLDVKDFELLCSLNVFNADLMNDAIYKFKRYEDSSLSYTGINRHEGEKIGLFNTVLDYDEMFIEQQASLDAPPVDESDVPDVPVVFEPDEEEEEETPAHVTKKERKGKQGKNGEIKIIQAAKTEKSTPAPVASPAQSEKPKPVAPPKPAFDESTISIGTKVFHKAFGHGVVQSIIEDRTRTIIIDFGAEIGVKSFIFPNALLQGFLRIET